MTPLLKLGVAVCVYVEGRIVLNLGNEVRGCGQRGFPSRQARMLSIGLASIETQVDMDMSDEARKAG